MADIISPSPALIRPLSPSSQADRLRVAASKGHTEHVQEILRSGPCFEPDRDGRTALHYAAQNGYVDTCKLLIAKGINIDGQDALGYTALHRAAASGHVSVVQTLLEEGCSPDCQDEHGNSALHEAAWNGYSKTLEALVKYNCNIFLTNKAGFTALHLAAQNGHNESSRVMLYAGCNSDLKNNYGDTALHTAARYGHAGVTRIMLSARCKLNEQNKNGDTALHIAAALKRRKIAKLLVEAKADVQVRNKQNETAADVARRKEHPEIIVIITSLTKPHTLGHHHHQREPTTLAFKDDITLDLEGPVVVPEDEPPLKPEKQEKERRFFFFKKKKKDKEKEKDGGVTVQSPKTANQKVHPVRQPVQGFFSQYAPRPGMQYYRDLAGNVKQGPIGYTPVCQCVPVVKRLEQNLDTTRENLYEHIDASNTVLRGQLDQLDRRTAQQVYSIDQLTKERLDAEHQACHTRISQRLFEERQETANLVSQYNNNMKTQIQSWLEDKLANYGHCLDHHHDDSALPPRNIFFDIHETENGRLFKSRSDETLSVSDYSGKFRKRQFYESRQAAMQQIRSWQLPQYRDRDRKREKTVNFNLTQPKVHVKDTDRKPDGASPKFEGSPSAVVASRSLNLLSPSTNSTVSPTMLNPTDRQTFASQGAIPKHLSHSHSWQPQSALPGKPLPQRDRSASPYYSTVNVRPRELRESSPSDHKTYGQQHRPGIVHSQTDSSNLGRQSQGAQKSNLGERGFSNPNKPSGARESSLTLPLYPGTRPQGSAPITTVPSSGGRYSVNQQQARSGKHPSAYPSPQGRQQVHPLSSSQPQFHPQSSQQTHLQPHPSTPHLSQTQHPQMQQRTAAYRVPHNQENARGYVPSPYQPRTKSSDNLLHDNDRPYGQQMPRSKSVENTLEESDTHTTTGVSPKPVPCGDRRGNPQTSVPGRIQTSTPDPYFRRTAPYRVVNSSTSVSPARDINPSPIVSGESPYATVRDMSNKLNPRAPRDSPTYHSAANLQKEAVQEGNYSDYGRLNKDKPSFRSMYGFYGDRGHQYAESRPLPNPLSKSENNISGQNSSPVISTPSPTANNKNSDYQPAGGYLNGSHHPNDSGYMPNSVFNPAYHNNKEDSSCSSNPDSGYSSKAHAQSLYGTHAANGPSNSGTPSSSFSMDRSISTPPSHTNSPYLPTTNGGDYEPVQPSRQYFNSVQSHVQEWYQRKLLEAAERLRNSEQYGRASSSNFGNSPVTVHYDPVHGSDV